MANQDRTRMEVLRRREYLTESADAINVGDLLVLSSGVARPASIITSANVGGAATRKTEVQDGVADGFIGIALHGKKAGETPKIAVGIDVLAEMDVPALASDQHVGDLVELNVSDDGTTGTGKPQEVWIGSTNPIGKVAKEALAGDTLLTCHFIGRAALPGLGAAD